jgi:hypothetical protein
MDRDEYNALKQSGGLVTDAALQDVKTEIIDDQYEEDIEQPGAEDIEQEDDSDESHETAEASDEEQEPELSPKEKTAFEKRMERERIKLEEKLRKELEEQTEAKYSKHKQAIEALGGDPDRLLQAAKDAQMKREAERLADQNGWTDEQTEYWIEQQKQQQELKELRVQMQINKLRDNPDYAGIANMERDILAKIDKTNGALSVEEAYWALGGPKRAEQMKLEAQQREIANRQKPTRTVLTDSPTSSVGEKPLPAATLREAERMGITPAEARRLMSNEPAQNIDEWRARRAKAK